MDNTTLFSGRVDDYKRFRPTYPQAIIGFLKKVGAFSPQSVAADIGAGTGILTRMLITECQQVFAVEPNQDMYRALEELKHSHPAWDIQLVSATGENTTLETSSIDLITIASALHWLDLDSAKKEFRRILKPDGYIAIFYNERDREHDVFQQEYQAVFARYFPDRKPGGHNRFSINDYRRFFDGEMTTYTVLHRQEVDYEGLVGLSRSKSSYPKENRALCEQIERDLQQVFERFKKPDGLIDLTYYACVYLGQFKA